jgi:phosphatidate cytidylyltransferase
MNFDRILLGLFWLPILLVTFLLGNQIHLFVLLLAICSFSLLEYLTMCRGKGLDPPGFLTVGGGIAVLAVACWWGAASGLAVAMLVTLGSFAAFPFTRRAEGTMAGAATVALAMIWIPLPLAHMMYLRDLQSGGWLLFMMMGIIWLNDTGAYFVGKLAGRQKLSPTISPGKTIEGTIGGLLIGFGGAFGLGWALRDFISLSFVATLTLGAAIPIVAFFGDMAESAFKRDAGIKDSGNLMGSHGGVLDRFDSSFFAAPTAWYLIVLMQQLNLIVIN